MHTRAEQRRPVHGGVARVLRIVFGVVVALIGAVLAAGGVWLIALGGSWYYAPAGIALAVAGAAIAGGRVFGVWLYWLVVAATVMWALWEVGLDPWALVPRLLALVVLGVLALCFVPHLRRIRRGEIRQ